MKRYAPYGLVILILVAVAAVVFVMANRDNLFPPASTPAAMNKPAGPMVKLTPTPGVYTATSFDKAQPVALSDLRGQVVFLTRWKTSCAGCTAALPGLENLWQNYKDKGLVVIAVNLDAAANRDKVQAAITQAGLTMPVWNDPQDAFTKAFKTDPLPGGAFIAKNGLVALTWTGLQDFMRHDVLWAIDQTLEY